MNINKKGYVYQGIKPLAHIIWNEHNPDNPWSKGYVVHHIDENPFNNNIENLTLLSKATHLSLHQTGNKHWLGKKHSEETKLKMSEKSKGHHRGLGVKKPDEFGEKISKIHKGKVIADWHKLAISESHKGKKLSEETKQRMAESRKGKSSGMKGKIPWNIGKKHSDETKRKISEKAKERFKNKGVC